MISFCTPRGATIFKDGQPFTVEKMSISSSYSYVYVTELPGQMLNTLLFENDPDNLFDTHEDASPWLGPMNQITFERQGLYG